MANIDSFSDGLQFLNEHVSDLRKQVAEGPTPRHSLLDMAFETMNSTLEELRVAEEEMRSQNESLSAAHDLAETWRHYYEDLFQSAPDAYLVTDMDGVIQEANLAAAELLGLTNRFLKGKPLATFMPEDGRQTFRQLLLEVKQASETIEREMWLKPRKSAFLLEISVTLSVVRNVQGQPQSLRWLIRDISERNRAETERYRLLVQEVQDYAIVLLDRAGSVLTWNLARNIS